jgi:short-subunit dehydrogenase
MAAVLSSDMDNTDKVVTFIEECRQMKLKVAPPHVNHSRFMFTAGDEKTIIYGTTKRALTYFMKGLAKELRGTNVIAGRLSPGMLLTDFITKSPDGEEAAVFKNERFKKVFNILADKSETVADFFIPKILSNTKNNKHIMWLTGLKATCRFIRAPFRKGRLIK